MPEAKGQDRLCCPAARRDGARECHPPEPTQEWFGVEEAFKIESNQHRVTKPRSTSQDQMLLAQAGHSHAPSPAVPAPALPLLQQGEQRHRVRSPQPSQLWGGFLLLFSCSQQWSPPGMAFSRFPLCSWAPEEAGPQLCRCSSCCMGKAGQPLPRVLFCPAWGSSPQLSPNLLSKARAQWGHGEPKTCPWPPARLPWAPPAQLTEHRVTVSHQAATSQGCALSQSQPRWFAAILLLL